MSEPDAERNARANSRSRREVSRWRRMAWPRRVMVVLPSEIMFDLGVLGFKAFDIELYQINALAEGLFHGPCCRSLQTRARAGRAKLGGPWCGRGEDQT